MQPAEKQEFIQYLEKGGVIDVLTKGILMYSIYFFFKLMIIWK